MELLRYLKLSNKFDLLVLLAKKEIHYQEFYNLNIPYKVLGKSPFRLKIFYQIHEVCSEYKPDLIHVWGRMQVLYTLPAAVLNQVPIVNSQITGAPARLPKFSLLNIIDRLNFKFSEVVLANSQAGINSYYPPQNKCKVIYNGMNLARFEGLPSVVEVKSKYDIITPYAVIMVASFTAYKNYDLFFRVAEQISSTRTDITFIGVGGGDKDNAEQDMYKAKYKDHPFIKLPGKINDVEALVNVCDIGILLSQNGEGISNAILEYMALEKPVIATNCGGTIELIANGNNGYLVDPKIASTELANMIINLIDNPEQRVAFGTANREKILREFNIDKMGEAFDAIYERVLHTNKVKA